MLQIGLLSDTHSYLPPEVFKHFADCDEIWHVGDFGDEQLVEQLQQFKPLMGVWGNIDGQKIRSIFPEVNIFYREEVKIVMVHIGGYPPRYNKNSLEIINQEKPHLFISGHSHILKVIPDVKKNLLHLNPGACGKQGWHKVKTLMKFQINKNRISELKIIELGKK